MSNWEETRRDVGLNSQPKYEGSLISPQMGQHKSCRSSSLHSSCPPVHPAWRRVNLRMLQVCFLCGLMVGELWKQTPTVMLHTHPHALGCLRQRAGSSPGQSFALSGPTVRIVQPTRGVLGQVRAGVFKIMEQCSKMAKRGLLQRGRRI